MGLVQAMNGDLYGTTSEGGVAWDGGTIFKITPGGTLTTLHSFCSQSGCTERAPRAALVQATNGDLYGTTAGNPRDCATKMPPTKCGAVFKITPSGTLTTLYRFCSQTNCPDGAAPRAALVQAINGDFYGTTSEGGANGNGGTVFKITPAGTLTTLYSFCSLSNCADGGGPRAGLAHATDGDFYGTTYTGWAGNGGTVFKITPGGTLTTLYSFCTQSDCTDGFGAWGLVQATSGDFYGTTEGGGTRISSYGTVFKITPGGTLTTLYSFCTQSDCTDGFGAWGLVQATSGDFYGTTQYGGPGSTSNVCFGLGCGTVFSLSVGLGPFVKTIPAAGVVGEGVRILGYELTGATSVTFNGVAAVFTVVSGAEITTTVPTGATTGKIEVVTPSGTLSSNVEFWVLQ